MKRTRFKLSMFLAAVFIAFSAGHSLGADCPYHQPECGYAVSGCIQLSYSCQANGGGSCWQEYGKCCEEPGTDRSIYCGGGCDAGGGGGCDFQM